MWPYLALAKDDAPLRELLEGVIRRQARMILLDPYANAFMHDAKVAPLSWADNDKTEYHPGVGERKWEVDSLCYTIRLAHGYWRATADTLPFDGQWKEAAWTIVRTFRAQQRKQGKGLYSFERKSAAPSDTLPLGGYGNPARPVGMIFSMFSAFANQALALTGFSWSLAQSARALKSSLATRTNSISCSKVIRGSREPAEVW